MLTGRGRGLKPRHLAGLLAEEERAELQQAWSMTLLWQLTAAALALGGARLTLPGWLELFPFRRQAPEPQSAGEIRQRWIDRLTGQVPGQGKEEAHGTGL